MAISSIASGTSDVRLLAANAQRKGFIVVNDDANRLYVLLGSGTSSSTNYSFSLAQNENAQMAGYVGELRGVWAADGSGSARVTEY